MSEFKHMTRKFRPVLTLEQIHHIASLCKASECDALSQSILKVVVPMIAKVEVGAISPAYKLSETHAQKLAESKERARYENGEMSPEEEMEFESKILGV